MEAGQDVLAERDTVLLMQAAQAQARRLGGDVSVVLSGHTHAPCFITDSAHPGSTNVSVLHATLSACGWRMRPDASCALLLLHEHAAQGSGIELLPLPHEHLSMAVAAAACVAVLVAAAAAGGWLGEMGRVGWRLKRRKAS
jgi:hypothetical protein